MDSHPLTRLTPNTIVDKKRLINELEDVREKVYAIDDEENVPGIRCIAAPICNYLGQVTHAVSFSVLTLEKTWSDLEGMAPMVIEVATKISQKLDGTSIGGIYGPEHKQSTERD
ncbi:hypothetical protein GCM10007359_10900 [Rothia aerolata]|uniref:IclR-ED domain-containing protein n=1 Tax=Rothia aerolata TaxID=1812262 RepID=A0A917ITQ2_9MICC|nr:hypothetical protein GCM10007359_10900 [Rothia aerolata]